MQLGSEQLDPKIGPGAFVYMHMIHFAFIYMVDMVCTLVVNLRKRNGCYFRCLYKFRGYIKTSYVEKEQT